MEKKRKTPLQAEALLKFYSEEKYPTKSEMDDLALALNLTYKQVRAWFLGKRRREKCDSGIVIPSSSGKKLTDPHGSNGLGVVAGKIVKRQDSVIHNNYLSLMVENGTGKKKNAVTSLQGLLTPDYILKKVFRKDGPPLGVEFDSLPSQAFCRCKDSRNARTVLQENPTAAKRRKASVHEDMDREECWTRDAVRKHGMGKGLMTAWRVMNPNGGTVPTGIDNADRQVMVVSQMATLATRKPPPRKKRAQQLVSLLKQKRLADKLLNKKKPLAKGRQAKLDKEEKLRQPRKEKCELAPDRIIISQERLDQIAMLLDDEELELRELEAAPNPLSCCGHVSTKGLRGCSLCRDLLAKFPPKSVKMKQPFVTQPWDSSPDAVKKLFKVFHFLYTYADVVDICSFTLDEFAQAFHDKDSLLLGKLHVALLKLLLSDVETELGRGSFSHLSVSCKFLALLHSVENQEFFVEFWNKSLNPLTWTEILRQVLVAAGFGSKQGASRKESLSKEMILMLKYGLQPGTLKGELFRVLLEQGNNGLKVYHLARSSQIAELKLASTTEEIERLISSTLSSDITLFEKIGSSAYRLRINSSKEADDFESDLEDIGSVDDNSDDDDRCSNHDDSECIPEDHRQRRIKHLNSQISKNDELTVCTEIDESHRGEVWLLGLMEGEYSELTVEEKLNALVALIDLVSAGSSIRMEDPTKAIAETVPSVRYYGSGAKIKRSLPNQHSLPRPSWVHTGDLLDIRETNTSQESRPVDSSSLLSNSWGKEKLGSCKAAKETGFSGLHPMQSIYLGSDRRYNRYWLFLGPCNFDDPGHKRVYFESSEDGHWEVIDTEEALRALLSVLDDRGRREALLIETLEKREAFLCQEMSSRRANNSGIRHVLQSDQSERDIVTEDSNSPVSDVDNNLALTETGKDSLPSCGAIILEVGKKGEEQNRMWSRLQEFDAWIWNSFYLNLNAVKHGKRSYLDSLTRCECCHDLYWRDEKHCKICHTTFELDFDLEERYAIHVATCRGKGDHLVPKHKILSSQLQSLKAAVYAIESVMPEDALVGAWSKSAHKLWVKRLRRTSSLPELLQVVADFVGAINESWLYQWNAKVADTIMDEIVVCFPSMPQTSSALSLWLVKLDAIIAPYLEKVISEQEVTDRPRGRGKRALVQ